MKKIILLAIMAVSFVKMQAQTDTTTVVVNKDERIDLLVKKQIEINEVTTRNSRRNVKGYRLMVINTNKRDEAMDAKAKIYAHFPELKSYLIYQSPYFKLKAGNFKERDEAEAYRKKLNAIFPKGVFIMQDTVELKPDKEEDEDL